MRALDGIQRMFGTIAARIAAVRRGSQFSCGDCERNEQCGLPPGDNKCVVKAEQIAREGDTAPRPPHGYFTAVWPR